MFLLAMDRFLSLVTKIDKVSQYFYVADIIMSCIICSFILIILMVFNNDYYQELVLENPIFKKTIGFLIVIKSMRFYKLFLYND